MKIIFFSSFFSVLAFWFLGLSSLLSGKQRQETHDPKQDGSAEASCSYTAGSTQSRYLKFSTDVFKICTTHTACCAACFWFALEVGVWSESLCRWWLQKHVISYSKSHPSAWVCVRVCDAAGAFTVWRRRCLRARRRSSNNIKMSKWKYIIFILPHASLWWYGFVSGRWPSLI